MRHVHLTFTALVMITVACHAKPSGGQETAAPVPAKRAVRDTQSVARWVFRVSCKSSGLAGTTFVHRSGRLITAAHVVEGCKPEDIVFYVKDVEKPVTAVVTDAWLDLALLTPKDALGTGLALVDAKTELAVGDTVVTWGFPDGYFGIDPMVSVGYLAGLSLVPAKPKPVGRAYINGAFNHGNSGGPVVDVNSLAVVGVVHAKVAPVPADVKSALEVMGKTSSGLQYTATRADGTSVSLSEAQVVSRVLEHLQSQTQLVIGMAVLPGDIIAFLKAQGVEP